MGLAPRGAAVGDWVVLCEGGARPLVVRQSGERLELVGDSYVHGIMNGEAWDEGRCERMWSE